MVSNNLEPINPRRIYQNIWKANVSEITVQKSSEKLNNRSRSKQNLIQNSSEDHL